MKNISNIFSWAFIVGAIFLCHGVVADDISVQFSGSALDQYAYLINFIDDGAKYSISQNNIQTWTLCQAGEYVSACGAYRVGFEWLKNVKLQDTAANTTTEYETKNYYTGDRMQLFKQMQIFFNDKNSGSLLDSDGNVVSSTDYIKDREVILNNVCNPMLAKTVCAKCPNNGNVDSSTVMIADDSKIVKDSWKFYTFADCYMEDFKDTTGNYYYVDGNDAQSKCYYTSTDTSQSAEKALNGDSLNNFTPVLQLTTTTLGNPIPISGTIYTY